MAGHPGGLRIQRRNMVGQLWLRGFTSYQIADYLRKEGLVGHLKGGEKTHDVTVRRDIAVIRGELQARIADELDKVRADQVGRILEVIREAWRRYMDKKTKDEQKPQLLNTIINAEDKLAKILGTHAPIQLTGEGGEPLVPSALNLIIPEGTVIKHGRMDNDGNGHKPVEVEAGGDGHSGA